MKKNINRYLFIIIWCSFSNLVFAATDVNVVSPNLSSIANGQFLASFYSFLDNNSWHKIETIVDWPKMYATREGAMPSFQSFLNTNVVSNAFNPIPVSSLMPSSSDPNNNVLSIENFLGPLKYPDATVPLQYINYLSNLVPASPPLTAQSLVSSPLGIIVPYSPDASQPNSTTPISFSSMPFKTLDQIQNALNNIPSYQSYLAAYRSQVAARAFFLDTMFRSYAKRIVPQQGTKKTIAEMEHEEVQARLTSDYSNKIQSAALTTIHRETLFVLAKISQQLDAIQQNQERMLVMQSLNVLQTASSTSTMTPRAFGQMVFCLINPTSTACQNQGYAAR